MVNPRSKLFSSVDTFVPVPWNVPSRMDSVSYVDNTTLIQSNPPTGMFFPIDVYACIGRFSLPSNQEREAKNLKIQLHEASHVTHKGHQWEKELHKLTQTIRGQENTLHHAKQVNRSLHTQVLHENTHNKKLVNLSLRELCMQKMNN